VSNLFVHPSSECARTLKREQVQLLDPPGENKLLKIQCANMSWLAKSSDLSNQP
jgi:hypothetical protein